MADRDHRDNLIDDIKTVFDTKPEAGSDGIGPTLGQDVGGPNRAKRAPENVDAPDPTGGVNQTEGL